MIRFEFVAVGGCKFGMRFANVAIAKHCVEVAGKEVMPEFVRDAEPLEAGVVDVGGIGDPAGVAGAQQNAGHAFGARWLGNDLDVEVAGDDYGINGKSRNPALPDDLFGLKARRQVRIGPLHFAPLRARSAALRASVSSTLSATSRSSDERRS